MKVDEQAWAALLVEQQQVASRAQALACGWNPRALEHRVGRSWQRVLPAVYLVRTGTPTWEQKAWAAVLLAGAGAALTSWSGLATRGLVEERADVHVVLPHSRRLAAARFEVGGGAVLLHRTTRAVAASGSPPTASVERCLVDACLAAPLSQVRALVSSVVQRGRTTVERLAAELEGAPRRGSGHLRATLSEVGEGARSAPEAALARAMRRGGLPPYRLNADVRDERGTWLARGDVVFEALKLVVEVDGERWHLSADRWVADVERHTRMEAAGWTVLRYPASRVLREPEAVVAEIRAVAARLQRRLAAS